MPVVRGFPVPMVLLYRKFTVLGPPRKCVSLPWDSASFYYAFASIAPTGCPREAQGNRFHQPSPCKPPLLQQTYRISLSEEKSHSRLATCSSLALQSAAGALTVLYLSRTRISLFQRYLSAYRSVARSPPLSDRHPLFPLLSI